MRASILCFSRIPPKVLVLLIGLSLHAAAFAEGPSTDAGNTPSNAVRITTTAGLLSGTAQELVYDSGYTVSRLDWGFDALYYYGMGMEYAGGQGFFASLDLKSGIPGVRGRIGDSDYLNYDGVKTHYSEHDCYTEQALWTDLRVGWSFSPASGLRLAPYAYLGYMNFAWTARDGYLQYPDTPDGATSYTPWSEDVEKTAVYGIGIRYQQTYISPGLGVKLDYFPLPRLHAAATIDFSPAAFCSDRDDHFFRSLIFEEDMDGGVLANFQLAIAYTLTHNTALELDIGYKTISGLRGDSTVTGSGTSSDDPDAGASYSYPDSAGAAFKAFEAGVTFQIAL